MEITAIFGYDSKMDYKKQGHCVYYTRYHLVMATKYRRKILKAKTGLRMRQKFPFLEKVYWGNSGIWSRGYFVSTVGISEATIRKYIEMQGKEDSGQALLEF